MFKKAQKARIPLKIAIVGPSGSGKTYSALSIAQGLGKKVAVIDTENGSASLYADSFEFDVVELSPPYTAERYQHLVKEASKAGYEVLVIDSLSHVWNGEGGVIDEKETLDERPSGSKFSNWRKPKSKHRRLIDEILAAPMHVITTIRSKQGYVQTDDGKGKSKIQKVGMDPIAEPLIEYEFTLVLDMDMSHNALGSKDRTGLFNEVPFRPSPETGEKLVEWLNRGSVEIKKGGQFLITQSDSQFVNMTVEAVVNKIGWIKAFQYADWLAKNRAGASFTRDFIENLELYKKSYEQNQRALESDLEKQSADEDAFEEAFS